MLTFTLFILDKANSFEKKKSIADSYRSCVICNHRVEDPSSWNVLLLHQQQSTGPLERLGKVGIGAYAILADTLTLF